MGDNQTGLDLEGGSRTLSSNTALVLGGARSGKSRYALTLAEKVSPERLMIASYVAHASGIDDGLFEKLPSKAKG